MAAASTNPRSPHCCRCALGVGYGTETGSSTIRLCTRAHASVRRSSVPTGPAIFHLRISCCELMLTRDMQHVGRGRNRFPAPAAVVPPPIQNYISIDPFSAEQSFPTSFSRALPLLPPSSSLPPPSSLPLPLSSSLLLSLHHILAYSHTRRSSGHLELFPATLSVPIYLHQFIFENNQ